MFYLVLGRPSPGVPGEGPDGHVPSKIEGFGPVSARIRGVCQYLFDLCSVKRSWAGVPGAYPGRKRGSAFTRVPGTPHRGRTLHFKGAT